MLRQREAVEAQALRRRGWTISAIARHLSRDRKTVRAHLNGEREPGKRRSAGPDTFAVVEEYCRIRLRQDPHLPATTLFEEVAGLGFEGRTPPSPGRFGIGGCGRIASRAMPPGGRDVAIINHELG